MSKPHYLLVEIRNNDDVSTVRKALHATGANLGDIIIRSDRSISFHGLNTEMDYTTLSGIFRKHMNRAKQGRQ